MQRRVVADMIQGKMLPTSTPPLRPDRANFVICCQYGDWSNFRTLAECQKQYRELEEYHAKNTRRVFWVEER